MRQFVAPNHATFAPGAFKDVLGEPVWEFTVRLRTIVSGFEQLERVASKAR
jgi:hypothetical protein